jgi:putative tricarboxylic transport membrane protein
VLAELKAGRVRLIGISAPARLTGLFADAPVWNEQGVDCVVDAWRGVTGPAGMTSAQVGFWDDVLRAAVAQPTWQQELSRLSWSSMYRDGPVLHAYLAAERAEFVTVLGDLELLKAPATSA